MEITINRASNAIVNVLSSWLCVIFLSLAVPILPHSNAQQQATLFGNISDPSGAVVPKAIVRMTDKATQVTKTSITNGTGYYLLLNLTPGTHRNVAQKEDFKTATQDAVTLEVAQSADVDLRLEVGDASENVSVTGAAPFLQTTDPTIGQIIGPATIVEMPLNGRNYF